MSENKRSLGESLKAHPCPVLFTHMTRWLASCVLAFVSEWYLRCVNDVCPLFLAEGIWHLGVLMFRTANLKTIGKAGTGWYVVFEIT